MSCTSRRQQPRLASSKQQADDTQLVRACIRGCQATLVAFVRNSTLGMECWMPQPRVMAKSAANLIASRHRPQVCSAELDAFDTSRSTRSAFLQIFGRCTPATPWRQHGNSGSSPSKLFPLAIARP